MDLAGRLHCYSLTPDKAQPGCLPDGRAALPSTLRHVCFAELHRADLRAQNFCLQLIRVSGSGFGSGGEMDSTCAVGIPGSDSQRIFVQQEHVGVGDGSPILLCFVPGLPEELDRPGVNQNFI